METSSDSGDATKRPLDPMIRRVDVSELRSHMSACALHVDYQSPVTVVCSWLLQDEGMLKLFQQFDDNASGAVTLSHACDLLGQGFHFVSTAGHTLSGRKTGYCNRHGVTEAFAADGYCVRCERKCLAKEAREGSLKLTLAQLTREDGYVHKVSRRYIRQRNSEYRLS